MLHLFFLLTRKVFVFVEKNPSPFTHLFTILPEKIIGQVFLYKSYVALVFFVDRESLSLWKKKEALLWIQEPFSGIFDSSVFSARELSQGLVFTDAGVLWNSVFLSSDHCQGNLYSYTVLLLRLKKKKKKKKELVPQQFI
ncbi:TMV resistance protein N-like [Pyrus ussuriensis x Pyrus communis]|uniref:TMV resistance protein N-like n=1 Tax=Pyrus ussuriensis x Pyrus communis TaxID=2448454 RepID=A0A5N5FN10_9ROSA|nr:TMV resistance protein N-like [Pyrus ussuriensis x Pyrus communis]